ncbi:unnamed protein product [Allacma fusca]|uniref:Secreted protein n=1 Tax=Allacma fusca TaxID=39272 RepID=A0A8J2JZ24_9HEXA|nr:unnamed protein product [Allacma fusca]
MRFFVPVSRLFAVVVFLLLLTDFAHSRGFLRRVVGDKQFCEHKLHKCLHERMHQTRRSCLHRLRTKHGCADETLHK